MRIGDAISWMELHKGLVVPHGLPPGSVVGGLEDSFTAETWAAYDWDTVGGAFSGITEPDPTASPKPTWGQITAAQRSASRSDLLTRVRRELADACRRRITAAYGERTLDDEILLRLRAGQTSAQDTERDRLRSRYKALLAGLAAMTVAQLRAFVADDDKHWRE